MGVAGFCTSCDVVHTERDCVANIANEGKKDCLDVCKPEACAGDICSANCPCAAGSMCNFDHGTSGTCESCDDFEFEQERHDTKFKTKTGTQECVDVCFKMSTCERERKAAVANEPHEVGVFVPKCEDNGDYSPEQCHSSGVCWCTKPDGTIIPGTEKRGRASC